MTVCKGLLLQGAPARACVVQRKRARVNAYRRSAAAALLSEESGVVLTGADSIDTHLP